MSKQSESSKVLSKYRICWLETRFVSVTVDATSPEETLKNAADYNQLFLSSKIPQHVEVLPNAAVQVFNAGHYEYLLYV